MPTLKSKFKLIPFATPDSGDTAIHKLLNEHLGLIVRLSGQYPRPDLSESPLLVAVAREDRQWVRRCLMALLQRKRHATAERQRLTDEYARRFEDGNKRPNPNLSKVSSHLIDLTNGIRDLFALLLKRRLPLVEADLVELIDAFLAGGGGGKWGGGIDPAAIAKQAKWFIKSAGLTPTLRQSLAGLRKSLDLSNGIDRAAAQIDRLLNGAADGTADQSLLRLPRDAPPPAAAGSSLVLVGIKQRLGLLPATDAPVPPVETTGPDDFPLLPEAPLREEHEVLSGIFEEFSRTCRHWGFELAKRPGGSKIFGRSPNTRGRYYLALCERHAAHQGPALDIEPHEAAQAVHGAGNSIYELGNLEAVTLDDRDLAFDAMLLAATMGDGGGYGIQVKPWMADLAERHAADAPLSPGERHLLHRLRCASLGQPPLGVLPDVPARLTRLIDGEGFTLLLVPGEHWSDAVHHDIGRMKPAAQGRWAELLGHAFTLSGGKPSKGWRKRADALVKAVGHKAFRDRVADWIMRVPLWGSLPTAVEQFEPDAPEDGLNAGNEAVLRGLLWMLGGHAAASDPSRLGDLLRACLKKVPGVGPRAVKVANGCVWSLGEMAGSADQAVRDAALAQLARLRARVTFKTTLKEIDKALNRAAAAAGVSREELDEIGLPTFGFDAAGLRAEDFGGPRAELRIDGLKVVTTWTNEKGKIVKSPPAAVRKDHAEMVKELKAAAKDAEGILLAQRDRFDALYLQQKTWPLAEFRDRVLGHPLAGAIARRLIWTAGEVAMLFDEAGGAADVGGKAVNVDESAEVSLWHPVGREASEVLAWRRRLEALAITQPFKQAHREVYVLTDAERATGTYSNRFAGHVLKQHQFNALCAARGWQNRLRLMVDDTYGPPTREAPAFGLRAEYWVEGAGEDCTDAGTYLYLATDQVRFYNATAGRNSAHAGGGGYTTHGLADRAANHPLPLDQIPPLALSELLRDVDLFVGVASVGNDPAWQDGGPDGRFRTYWQDYSFGDLSATAQTRKTVLEKLVPRLKIAGRAEVRDKWLVVRGDVRTYKIHLGSGNILMEPNDEYLCIVPSGSSAASDLGFLPFEGDRTLSVILSKAFLLAEDAKIKDRTILSQIRR